MPFRLSRFFPVCFVWALASFLCASGQAGQVMQISGSTPPSVPIKKYPVSGSVFNSVTNEPIRRALVRINSNNGQHVAFSGPDGRFQFAGIPEGSVWISAQRPGFFEPRSLSTSPLSGVWKSPIVGSGTNDFRVPLTPESKIVGTVLDTDGEPVEGVEVQVLAEQIMQGRKQWMNRGATSTDENGFYQLDGQMPGAVVACTGNKPVAPSARDSDTYPPRCFPNSPDPASAQVIDIAPGQSARADFSVQAVRSFTVSGTVVHEQGFNTNIWIEGANGQQSSVGQLMQYDPRSGRFVMGAVPNGTWNFHFQGNDQQGRAFDTTEEISVNGADVTGVQATLQPGLDIPVEVVSSADHGAQAGAGALGGASASVITGPISNPQQGAVIPQVRLLPVGKTAIQQYFASTVPNPSGEADAKPSIVLQSIPPGTYNVSAQSNGQGCVQSVSYGGNDLAREPLTLVAGSPPQPLLITLRNDCATLTVAAHSDQKDATGVLVLTSDAPGSEPYITNIQANSGSTDAMVATTVGNLSPGTYHVYALSDLDGVEFANPQAMRDYPSESITLEPNGKANITVELAARGKR